MKPAQTGRRSSRGLPRSRPATATAQSRNGSGCPPLRVPHPSQGRCDPHISATDPATRTPNRCHCPGAIENGPGSANEKRTRGRVRGQKWRRAADGRKGHSELSDLTRCCEGLGCGRRCDAGGSAFRGARHRLARGKTTVTAGELLSRPRGCGRWPGSCVGGRRRASGSLCGFRSPSPLESWQGVRASNRHAPAARRMTLTLLRLRRPVPSLGHSS